MRRKSNLSLDLFGDRLRLPAREGAETDREYRRMLKALRAVMEGELTGRQRECIRLRYFEQMRVCDIAEQLGLRPATVSIHIRKGRERLGRVLRYSFSRLDGDGIHQGR